MIERKGCKEFQEQDFSCLQISSYMFLVGPLLYVLMNVLELPLCILLV